MKIIEQHLSPKEIRKAFRKRGKESKNCEEKYKELKVEACTYCNICPTSQYSVNKKLKPYLFTLKRRR